MNDVISDTLARLSNAVMRKKASTDVMKTKLSLSLVEILLKEEMIEGYEENDGMLTVNLKYENGQPTVSNFERVSKPGQRIYIRSKEILPVMNGRGIAVISTSEGLMNGAMAKSKSLGGEYLCKVW